MIPTPSMPDCTSATSAWSCGTLGSIWCCLWCTCCPCFLFRVCAVSAPACPQLTCCCCLVLSPGAKAVALCWSKQQAPTACSRALCPCAICAAHSSLRVCSRSCFSAVASLWHNACSAHMLDAALQPVRLVVCVVGFVPCARGLAVE